MNNIYILLRPPGLLAGVSDEIWAGRPSHTGLYASEQRQPASLRAAARRGAAAGGHLLCCALDDDTARLRRGASHRPARRTRQNANVIH